jgi:hypothetical protein
MSFSYEPYSNVQFMNGFYNSKVITAVETYR